MFGRCHTEHRRHQKILVITLRCIPQCVFVRETRHQMIFAPSIVDIESRRHRLNIIGVDFRKLFDETQNTVKLWPELTNLLIG